MRDPSESLSWDLAPVIGLLHTLSPFQDVDHDSRTTYKIAVPTPLDATTSHNNEKVELGNFNKIFEYLQDSSSKSINTITASETPLASSLEQGNNVKWQDDVDAADLEDNVDSTPIAENCAPARTQKRLAQRIKAKRKKRELAATEAPKGEQPPVETDTASGDDTPVETPASPSKLSSNRKAVIQQLLFPSQERHTPNQEKILQPPTVERVTPRKEWPVSNPFSLTPVITRFLKQEIRPLDDLSVERRRRDLINHLSKRFPYEKKYLVKAGVTNPAFSAHNVIPEGIHVFVDISNITIGFHDRLKVTRDISLDQKVRRVPIDFFNFSLILERGRPAAKRVLVGSDQFPHIDQARSLGYETNILERVHKAKALKKNDRLADQTPAKNGNTTSGGASSGSETNTLGPAKWVEQAVDEILHLKILESIVDADKPGTIVLATGDAAMAEYSGGFLRMVERALSKGWVVELASFSAGLSSMYKRHVFRNQWGPMFKIIELDDVVEYMLDVDTIRKLS
ncbi:hypothetical protein UCRPC4_g01379 [Phaeomoniella chlamydospora]|uniref:NYN domain-containing protein n=1 Tax=Phaeomoniella chlamydospora TaxID=158046 RepID=A0A0G2GUH4_PHACM|nr:hypothetical protein UCRPC4_g01379 [Phaeomoniella chlamydospora]